jgi:hypothetical protein
MATAAITPGCEFLLITHLRMSDGMLCMQNAETDDSTFVAFNPMKGVGGGAAMNHFFCCI